MKKRVFASLFFAIASFMVAGDAIPPKAAANPDKADFGKYQANETKHAEFVIENKGGSELKILKISKTCGCAEATVDSMSVPPGGKTVARISVLPESIAGNYAKNVFLETNDPKNRLVQLQVSGNAVPLFEIKPQRALDLGRIKIGERKIQTFRIQPVGESFELGDPEVKGGDVETTLTKLPDGAWDLTAAVMPKSGTNGNMKIAIRIPLKSPSSWKSPEILLTARAGVELVATPVAISASAVAANGGKAQISLRLIGDEKDFPADSIAVSTPAEAAAGIAKIEAAKNSFIAEIKISEGSLDQVSKDAMKISFVHKPSGAGCQVLLKR